MKKRVLWSILAGIVGVAAGCGDRGPLFTPNPECKGDAVTPLTGSFPQVISKLAIGMASDGFDLDGDGKPDNKLAGVSSIAGNAIEDALNSYELMIPLEFFDFAAVAADTCVKFAIYLGKYAIDADGDGAYAYVPGGDCNDNDPSIKPGAIEIEGDGIDNDCDGLADESATDVPSSSTADDDQDGQTIAQGDCDDHNPMVRSGLAEICGDGLDNDCDGVADRTSDSAGRPVACSPYDPSAPVDLTLDPVSLEADGSPLVAFKDGTVDSGNKLRAGPSIFQISIPIFGFSLDLTIVGATIEATLQPDGTTTNGRIGGVIDARTADALRGIEISQIGLTPENSLLDAAFANSLGLVLALPLAKGSVGEKYPDCRTPDIDVDGDGLEAFCKSDPDGPNVVDICIDGDGTVIKDTATTHCTEALKDGKPRFVDGISVALKFSTSPLGALKPAP
jgi:predicted small lipoprotein YifL